MIAGGTLHSELSRTPMSAPVAPCRTDRRLSPTWNGFLIGISNPKDILFFIAFFPQFIGITPVTGLSLVLLTILWIAADFLILLAYSAAMKGGLFQRHQRVITLLSSGFLLAIAVGGFVYSLREMCR